jgi:hypothetical protein
MRNCNVPQRISHLNDAANTEQIWSFLSRSMNKR